MHPRWASCINEMRAKLTRELYWLLGTVILTGLIGLWIFGDKIFDSTPVDIQLHDTYYVFPKTLLLTVIFIGLLTTTYLTRGIYFKLNNKIINGILTILLLIILVGQIMYLDWVNGLESHLKVLYSREMDKEIQADVLSGFKVTKGTLWTLLIITGTILTTTGYKTFKTKRVD
jgi:hypothetical protein